MTNWTPTLNTLATWRLQPRRQSSTRTTSVLAQTGRARTAWSSSEEIITNHPRTPAAPPRSCPQRRASPRYQQSWQARPSVSERRGLCGCPAGTIVEASLDAHPRRNRTMTCPLDWTVGQGHSAPSTAALRRPHARPQQPEEEHSTSFPSLIPAQGSTPRCPQRTVWLTAGCTFRMDTCCWLDGRSRRMH